MERLFKLKKNGSNVRTEIMAGITTFMTMAYILAVNPNVLEPSGLEWYSVFLATALAAGIFTAAMGLFVNFPVALAPGMGLNAYFATVVLSSDGKITPEIGLTAVFISGLIFILLTVTHIRQLLLIAVPDSLKHAITVGIGLFITIIGLKNSGILTVGVEGFAKVTAGQFHDLGPAESVIHMGSLDNPNVQVALIGLLLITVMMVLRVKGAILFGILSTTLVAALLGYVDFNVLSGADVTWIPDFSQLNFAGFDWKGAMDAGLLAIIATFTFVELFDTFGTLVGTANRAGFMKDPVAGRKIVGKAMLVDAIAVSGGALLGTSTTTAFVESSAGVAEGGRTGLTSVTTGVCFLLALFLAPLVSLIPGGATAAALIVVGVLMMQSVKEIDFQDLVVGIPAFFTITFMPFTYNIANGISFGILSYVILASVANLRDKDSKYKVHWLMWVLAVLIVLRYMLIGSQG